MRVVCGPCGLLLWAIVATAACSEGEAGGPQPAGAGPAQPAVPVTTAPVVSKAMPVATEVVGTVEAYSRVAVRAQITGELLSVNFREGDDVTAGQELFSLDRRPLEAALQQATANLERDTAQAANAKVNAQRLEQLVERGIVSREQRDTAKAGVAALDATLQAHHAAIENAKVQLQYATIRAPISGRTGELLVNAGNLVRSNDQSPLVTINQVTPIYASFAFPEALLSELNRYMAAAPIRVEARATDGAGPAAIGQVTFVDNTVDQTTGTIRVKATFPNEDRRLWPGQFVNVTVRLTTESAAIVVPTLAVQTGPDGSYVFLVKDDQTVELRLVTVARVSGAESVVSKGLNAGDTVVTDGHLRLVPGSRVSLRDGAAPKAGS